MSKLLVIAFLCLSLSCAGLASVLAKAAQVGQWVGAAINTAEMGASAYYARHPSADERLVFDALHEARQKLELYDRAVALGADVANARAGALEAYQRLYNLLDSLGVLGAIPPMGGAETDAPEPKPFRLPTTSEIAKATEN